MSHMISHGEGCTSLRTIGCQQEYKQGFGKRNHVQTLYVAERLVFTHEECGFQKRDLFGQEITTLFFF